MHSLNALQLESEIITPVWLENNRLREKLFRIIYPKWTSWFRSCRNLYERYQFFVLIVYVSLRDHFSPLYKENKVSSRTTFATIYFPFNLFQGTAKPQNRRGKVETKQNSTTIELKQIQRPSMDGIHRWYLKTKS